MAKKLPVYMWEPLFNRLTRISTEYAHKVLGIIPSSLTRYIQNKTYNQKLECYFVREPLSVKEKRQLIQQIEIPNEIWRETKLEGLYVFIMLDLELKLIQVGVIILCLVKKVIHLSNIKRNIIGLIGLFMKHSTET